MMERFGVTFNLLMVDHFLCNPNNLCLKLNLDWFNPFKHVQYSVGVIYFVIENLPRTDRYKLENIIIISCIPGTKEPKKHINTYLKPVVDELLELWHGRCALTCITCDLPATRKMFFIYHFVLLRDVQNAGKIFLAMHLNRDVAS